jgi:predicted RNase H-like HicB family nuclease
VKIQFTEELWKEGNMYVSYSPELDIAACGETVEQAKHNLGEVIGITIEEMRGLGTLESYLREAGFENLGAESDVIGVNKELISFEPREIPV